MKKVKIFLASLLLICSQVAFANDPKQVASSFLNWCLSSSCEYSDGKEAVLNNPNLTDNFKKNLIKCSLANDIRDTFVWGCERDEIYTWDTKKSDEENSRLCHENLKKWLHNLPSDTKTLALEAIYDDVSIDCAGGATPIFSFADGMELDEKFIAEKYDAEKGYVLLKGKPFGREIYVKVVKKDGKYLIDGAGKVNIPYDLYNSTQENY